MRGLVATTLFVVATGCATQSVSVDHRMLLPETGARYDVNPAQFFVMPVALSAPEPAFPASVDAADSIEAVACVEIWLSAEGNVIRTAPFHATPDCNGTGDSQGQAFDRAVAETVRQWEFTPAMICEFPPQSLDKRAHGDCRGPEVVVHRVPVRLNYAFTFSSREGKRRVGIARKPSHDDGPDASGTR